MLAPSERGLTDEGTLFWAQMTRLRAAAGSGTVDLCDEHGDSFQDSALIGCWLCVPKAAVESSGDVFVYQLLQLPVVRAEDPSGTVVGRVAGYFENGAHGVLEVKLEAGGQALIPLVSAFCNVESAPGRVVVSGLDDFVS